MGLQLLEGVPMSLFTLIKITRTRHPLGNKQVPASTPAAVRLTEESSH